MAKNQNQNKIMITGQDIINLGFKTNKWFRKVIDYANANNLSGEHLKSYIESIRPKKVKPHTTPIMFYQNMTAENEVEAKNIQDMAKKYAKSNRNAPKFVS